MLIDYHVHGLAHGEYNYDYEWLSLFVEKARQENLQGIGLAEHDEFRHLINFALLEQLQQENPDIKIRIGLEVDYIPGREPVIRSIKAEHDWDYLIGSVHFIDDWAFDHPDHKDKFDNTDIDEIYFNYFKLVRLAVETNCFDIVGHLDLIKIWGHKPAKKTLLHYAYPVLEVIKDADIAVEINTGGLRKPVNQMYPALEIIDKMKAMNIKILFGSDAHHPDQVGMCFEQAVFLAQKAGYQELVYFTQHQAAKAQLNYKRQGKGIE